MPPRVQITKEHIMETALQLLRNEGSEAISITRLAEELKCSTQPISRTFGSMDNFRKELEDYTLKFFNRMANSRGYGGNNAVASLAAVEESYLKIAIEEPNLFRYVRSLGKGKSSAGGVTAVFDERRSEGLRQATGRLLRITDKQANSLLKAIVVYTQGLADMAAYGMVELEYGDAVVMLRELSVVYMTSFGIPRKLAWSVIRGEATEESVRTALVQAVLEDNGEIEFG